MWVDAAVKRIEDRGGVRDWMNLNVADEGMRQRRWGGGEEDEGEAVATLMTAKATADGVSGAYHGEKSFSAKLLHRVTVAVGASLSKDMRLHNILAVAKQ
jgi:hypothetical protein